MPSVAAEGGGASTPVGLPPGSSSTPVDDADGAVVADNLLPRASHHSLLHDVDDTLHHLWSTNQVAVLEWVTSQLMQQGSQMAHCGYAS